MTDRLWKSLVEDAQKRLNEAELSIVESKEFTHLVSDVFAIFQNELDGIKQRLEEIESLVVKPHKDAGRYL